MHFAYPKAFAGNAAVDDIVRGRFRSAAIARSRLNSVGSSDLHRLTRTPVQHGDSMDVFAHKARSGMRLKGSVRSVVAKRRSRGATQ